MANQKHYAYLSAAIRDGAKLRLQAFGSYFDDSRSCAIAAGLEAIYGDCFHDESDIDAVFPYMRRTRLVACPRCDIQHYCLLLMVYHLNDDHCSAREAIADWLYAEEEKLGFITLIETEASPELSLEITTVEQHSALSS